LATQWSSVSATNTVTRTGPGAYNVLFPGMAHINGGDVQVTAVGAGSARCKSSGPSFTGNDVSVAVACFDSSAPTDSQFVASYEAINPANASEAYTLYDPPANPAVTVPPAPFFSSDVNSIYVPTGYVTLSTPVTGFPIEHVTSAGPGLEQCSLNTTGISCFDATGTQVNTSFWYVKGLGQVPSSGLQGAFAVFDVPWSWVTTITPSVQQSSWPGSMTVQRMGTGLYQVVIPGAGGLFSKSMVQVTGYDIEQPAGEPAYCKTVQWAVDSLGNVVVGVACFWLKTGAVGTPKDHGFHVSFIAVPRIGTVAL
jgi:hypothetical protein